MARWTDITSRQETTSHRNAGGMRSHRGVVVHTASGYYEGTINWQQRNDIPPDRQVSSHFVVAKDGRICQMIDTADRSWAQAAGNDDWLSVENEGFGGTGGQPLTDAQIVANARILRKAHQVYGVPFQLATDPSGSGLGHHSMGAHPGYPDDWGHADCPGPPIIAQKPAILAAAQQTPAGPPAPPPVPLGDDMPNDMIPAGFGIDEHDGWLEPAHAVAVPLPAVGTGAGQWGPAWLYLAGTGQATIRYGCLPSGPWATAVVDLTAPAGPLGIPAGTTELLIARKRTSATDTADSAPVRWHVQYGAKS